jgi:hypothetical protein
MRIPHRPCFSQAPFSLFRPRPSRAYHNLAYPAWQIPEFQWVPPKLGLFENVGGPHANAFFTKQEAGWRQGHPGGVCRRKTRTAAMLKSIVLYLILGVSLTLQGCAGLAVASVSAGTMAVDKKLPPDYVAGWITGEDCSSLEFERNGHYCRTPEEIAAAEAAAHPAPPVYYCYRTLGVVDCTARPMRGEEARLVR